MLPSSNGGAGPGRNTRRDAMTVRTRFRCIFVRLAKRMSAGDRFLDIARVVRVNARRDGVVRKGAGRVRMGVDAVGGMREGDVRARRAGERGRGVS